MVVHRSVREGAICVEPWTRAAGRSCGRGRGPGRGDASVRPGERQQRGASLKSATCRDMDKAVVSDPHCSRVWWFADTSFPDPTWGLGGALSCP